MDMIYTFSFIIISNMVFTDTHTVTRVHNSTKEYH